MLTFVLFVLFPLVIFNFILLLFSCNKDTKAPVIDSSIVPISQTENLDVEITTGLVSSPFPAVAS